MTKNYRFPFLLVICIVVTAFSLTIYASSRVQGEGDYIIQKGDTLWDIAEKHLGDPLLWPQIWKLNPYIQDPHWIYPDNRLTLPTPKADLLTDAIGDTDEDIKGIEVPPETILPPPPAPRPLASRSEMYASGFISTRTPGHFFGNIIEAEELLKEGLTIRDIVYIDKGDDDGIMPGDIFFIIKQGPRIYHPVHNRFLGYLYNTNGILQVLCVQDTTATATIIQAFDIIRRGDLIEPYEELIAPTAIEIEKADFCQPAKGNIDGYIVASKDGVRGLAERQVTYIDIGTNDGVAPGDVFVAFKRPGGIKPDVYTGELVVIKAEENTSTAIIFRSKYEMAIGDYILQK